MKNQNFILTTFVLFTLTSCTGIMMGLYGLKEPKIQTTDRIEKYSKKYKVPIDNSFVLDTSYYIDFIKKIDTTKRNLIKNHYQPLQVLYFDKNERLISYHINCYAGGFPNLEWDRNGILDTFVPRTQTPLDTLLTFYKQLKFIRTLTGKTLKIEDFEKYDYNVVVYWNIFMARQSRRLIKFIKDNCELAEGKSVNLMYVNNDNIFGLVDFEYQ